MQRLRNCSYRYSVFNINELLCSVVGWAELAKPINREGSENTNDAPRSSAHPTLLSIIQVKWE